ncbi:cytochrome c biogenesis protein ResB [Microlunatus antarcticus]|nr:cytochrome c biogenesis protein ResB [Microlunatus antarcticus]
MRTALVLLFALAVAAIPGSLIPQRNVSPIRVDDFIAAHPTLGPVYDKVGLFGVYHSPWFSAVYLLLFVSLIGCIVPRVRVYARALRAQPPRTPRNLRRLPAYGSADLAPGDDAPAAVLERAAQELRRQHYRVRVEDGPGGSVAAERGYLREAGNLVFHVSLLFLLLGVAVGALWGYRGTSVVVVGQGFSNSITQYDDLQAGAWFKASSLKPFNVLVKDFQVKFEEGPVQTGAARLFRADLDVTDAPGDPTKPVVLEVNHPLNVDGSTVHLIGHGYAPIVTVKDGQGNVAFSGPVVFLPQDGNFTSAGVVKVPDARPERIALQGFFLPSTVEGANQAPVSAFPDALNPMLFVNVWAGPPAAETGKAENIYSLDTTGLTQVKGDDGAPLRVALAPKQGVTLPDGLGSVELVGWSRWVKLQVGNSPGAPLALGSIAFAVLGLCLSLFVRPRRVWVRLAERTEGEQTSTVVEVGGLDRADARGGLTDDVDDLVKHLTTAGRQDKEEASST